MPKTPEEQAAYWYVLLESPECTPKQRERFKRWLGESGTNKKAYQAIENGYAFVEQHLNEPVFTQMSQDLLEQVRPQIKKPWWKKLSVVAAIFVFIGTTFFMLQTSFFTHQTALEKNQLADSRIPADNTIKTYQTQVGERSVVNLGDGSVITLNTNSRIEVTLSPMRRSIKMLKGQAFFNVAKDINRPFMVDVGDKRVVALGTAFDIRFDTNQQVEVTLVEGRVAVDNINETTNQSFLSESNKTKPVELVPGEKLVAKGKENIQVSKLENIDKTTGWQKGRLICRQESINSVIQEMNRYSFKKIKLHNDSRILDIKINGVFDTTKPRHFVDTLTQMHPLEARQTQSNEITLFWRK
jgi:transmembrane sensor